MAPSFTVAPWERGTHTSKRRRRSASSTASATSSAVTCARVLGRPCPSSIAVSTCAGWTTENSTPDPRYSSRSDSVSPTTPCLVAEYVALPGSGTRPTPEATFTRWPDRLGSIRAKASFEPIVVPKRFTSISRLVTSSGSSWKGPIQSMPALLTITASGPCRSSAASRNLAKLSRSAMSSATAKAPSPISPATSSAAARSTSPIATRAPAPARRSAIARPIPWPPPVTAADAPASSGTRLREPVLDPERRGLRRLDLGRGGRVVLGRLLRAEKVGQLAGLVHLGDDVAAADELAVHEQLRDRRPVRDRRELLADARVGQDVERRVAHAERVQRARRPHREAARGLLGRALHEEHHLVLVDRVLQEVADLLVRHALLLPGVDVLIERAWIGPPISLPKIE